MLCASRIKRLISDYRQIRSQKKYKVRFYNCWDQPNEDMYWRQFIDARNIVPDGRSVSVFSVFGEKSIIKKAHSDINIFFSAENLSREAFKKYQGYMLDSQYIDLAMGFDYINHPKYIRFPLWMDYMFPADSTEADIRRICAGLRYPEIKTDRQFCCQVSSHDLNGIRGKIIRQLSEIGSVSCAGKFNHNDDSLQSVFGDDKDKYLKSFIFNVCPENSDATGYVTEKVFEAVRAGCIPLYWGAGANPEPEILNKDAMIIASDNGLSESQLALVDELVHNPGRLKDYLSQPRLLPNAEEVICETFHQIEAKLKGCVDLKS